MPDHTAMLLDMLAEERMANAPLRTKVDRLAEALSQADRVLLALESNEPITTDAIPIARSKIRACLNEL